MLRRTSSSTRGMNISRSRRPVAKNRTAVISVTSSYGLGSTKTIAMDAPASHTSARCKASTPGATVTNEGRPSAAAASVITSSQADLRWKTTRHCQIKRTLVSVLASGHQRHRCFQEDVEIEQHRPVLDVIE